MVLAQSLIQKVPLEISIETLKKPDWIFFSSRFGVESFFELGMIPQEVKWAAIGEITGKALIKHTRQPIDFTGDSNDTVDIARSFSDVCADQVVWFPGSKKSKRVVQKHLEEICEVVDLPIYDSIIKPIDIIDCQIYVFTSPLNVISFFERNNLNSASQIWAIGRTTEAELKRHTSQPVRLPSRSSVRQILDTIIQENL